nr:DUF5723 family protein [Pedobacter sp. SYSU D00535]
MLQEREIDARSVDINSPEKNRIFTSENTYLLMLRKHLATQYNKELGLSWQVKAEGSTNISNGTFAIFHNYRLFDPTKENENIFNNSGQAIAYHQFSLSYRENYNRKLAFGAKLSYLSGIAYSKLSIDKSEISVDTVAKSFNASVRGFYKSNFIFTDARAIPYKPGFRNPGLAITLSANYRTRSGWYFMGNLKDLGAIRWTKNSYFYNFNTNVSITNASSAGATKRFQEEIKRKVFDDPDTSAINTFINGKAEILVNRSFNNYHPNLIISKNIFFPGGNATLINTYKLNNFGFSLLTGYNFQQVFMLGGQFLFRSPNFDFFMGSDQLFNTYRAARGLSNPDQSMGGGSLGASAYLGMSMKFGRILERDQNANTIYGVKNVEFQGLFNRIFTKKTEEEKKDKKQAKEKKKKGQETE